MASSALVSLENVNLSPPKTLCTMDGRKYTMTCRICQQVQLIKFRYPEHEIFEQVLAEAQEIWQAGR